MDSTLIFTIKIAQVLQHNKGPWNFILRWRLHCTQSFFNIVVQRKGRRILKIWVNLFTISPKMLCPYYRDGITKLATYASLRYTSSLEVYEKKLKMLYNLYDRTTHDERKVVLVAFFFLAIGDLKRPTSSTNVPQSFQHFIYIRFMVLCTLKQKY